MVPFPVTLTDGLSYVWDFQNKGGVNRGTGGIFDGAFLNLDLPNVTEAQDSLGGRMLTISGDSRTVEDIALTRSVYVPDNAGWARFVDTATNTGTEAITYTIRIYSDFGADISTSVSASGDGDLGLGLTDDWVQIAGTNVAYTGVVWGNDSAGALAPVEASLANDDVFLSWDVVLQPGESVSILTYALQDDDPARMLSAIEALSGELTEAMLAGLDFATLDSIVNFDLGTLAEPQTSYLGNGYDDVLLGAEADEVFDAASGDDVVLAMGGDDHVLAGAGADVVQGGAGDDLLEGNAGDDVMDGGDGADRLEGDGPTGSTLSDSVSVAETGEVLALSVRLPETAPGESVLVEGIIGRQELKLDDLRVVYLVDTSSSMNDLMADTEIGDRNGDGLANRLIDAVVAGQTALSDALVAAGLEAAEVQVIAFDSSAETVYDGFAGGFVEQGLIGLAAGGGTRYSDALQAALDGLGDSTGGDVLVTVISDGVPEDDWALDGTDALSAQLRDPAGLAATILAVAIGPSAAAADLDRLDNGVIDGSQATATTEAEVIAALTASPVDPAEIADLSLRVNGVEVATLLPGDLVETPLGLRFSVEVPGLTIGAEDVVEIVMTASDGAATQIVLSTGLSPEAGSAGDDTLSGGSGNDRLLGDDGQDVLVGGTGNDDQSGGAGNDVLVGGDGADTLLGGSGDDVLSGGPGADILNGGAGTGDMVSYAGSNAAVNVNLATQTASGGEAEGDILLGFEAVEGSSFDDVLIGSDGDDLLRPGLGDDTVTGGLGQDIVDYSTQDAGVVVNLSLGAGFQDVGLSDRDYLEGIEGVRGSRFTDYLYGTSGTDILDGGDGTDYIKAYDGNDIMYGGGGLDWLRSEAGDDLAYGGDGDDRFRLGDGNDTGYGETGNDNMQGFAGNDTFYGGAGDDLLIGGRGEDVLYGGDGIDGLQGGNNPDQLYGGSGDDFLYGGNGPDLLVGGPGDDVMFGDLGFDDFIFERGWGFDSLRDFTPGEDQLDLSDLMLPDFAAFLAAGSDRPSGVRFDFGEDGFFISDLTVADFTQADVIL